MTPFSVTAHGKVNAKNGEKHAFF